MGSAKKSYTKAKKINVGKDSVVPKGYRTGLEISHWGCSMNRHNVLHFIPISILTIIFNYTKVLRNSSWSQYCLAFYCHLNTRLIDGKTLETESC